MDEDHLAENYCTTDERKISAAYQLRESADSNNAINFQNHAESNNSSSMFSHQQQQPAQKIANTAAESSSASSIATAAAAGVSENSVVPDLMKIYESMTQGSNTESHLLQQDHQQQYEATTMHPTQQHQQQQHSSNGTYPQHNNKINGTCFLQNQSQPSSSSLPPNWTYEASSVGIHIPDVPPYPPQQSILYSSRNDEDEDAVATKPKGGGGGRILRKKRSNPNKDSGYASSSNNSGGESRPASNKTRRKSKSGSDHGGGGSKSGSKKNENGNDGRWSKRFTWPEELHRDFVSAVFDVGLKHASPSTVLEHMPVHEQITTERIKSHLQKYRLHRQKSKKEFMTSYAATLHKLNHDVNGSAKSMQSLAGGQVAAHLTHATMHMPDPQSMTAGAHNSNNRNLNGVNATGASEFSSSLSKKTSPGTITLPRLTEEEKASPTGASLGYLMGLFLSLQQQLEQQRQRQREAANVASAAAAERETIQQSNQDRKQESASEQHAAATAVFDDFMNEPIPCLKRDPSAGEGIAAEESRSLGRPSVHASANLPSVTRTNLEENSMMKREMQSQMAFQNKMRALKQQELNKYKANDDPPVEKKRNSSSMAWASDTADYMHQQQKPHPHPAMLTEYQGAGESEGIETPARDGTRTMSPGPDEDDFWNASMVDNELFDFLMNS